MRISWLFFIPFCLILLGVEPHIVSGQCLDDQKSLLLQLKNNLTFNAIISTKLVTWSQNNSDCSDWKGVTFDGDGLVTHLNLSFELISDGIHNSTLFNLQHLKSLNLSYNLFNSTIPDEIGNLSTLSHLNLAYAGFVGQIPFTISHLTNLITLDISTTSSFFKQNLESTNFGIMIQNLSKLEELYLDGVNISAPGGEWGKALSSSAPKLRVLSLSNCYLSGPLDESLGNLHSLSVIHLDDNNLFSIVPTSFANFSNLTSLTLQSCQLYGNFPKQIFQIPTLENIDLSMNSLLHGSLSDFPKNNSLEKLLVYYTNFSGELPTSIGNLQKLSELDISSSNFSGALPSSMGKLDQLVNLDISSCKFSGALPSSMEKLSNLVSLQLAGNKFTGQIPSFHLAKNLTYIDLSYNFLGGTIPVALFALPSLRNIQLSQNNFTGQVPEFPNPSSSILETLDLSSNNLEGPLPKSIFELKNLRSLSLSWNKFNGTMQFNMIQRLRNLTSLELSYNNLSVNASGNYFPQFVTLMLASCKLTDFPDLKNQSKLAILDLSDNQLHGAIPNWIWGLDNLMFVNFSHNHLMSLQEPYAFSPIIFILDLHSNQLRGKIPLLPPAPTYIDLSINNFSSSIPVDIGNHLSQTIFFSISKNRLTGVIPKSICNATFLRVLDLSYNNLYREIPECLFMSQTLGVLNIRKNNFNGSISDTFPVSCSLETLDLNGNSIEGPIPNSLSSCTKLEVLDVGNNQFTGEFPCLLEKVSTLRVLVLQSNKFNGSVRCSNSNESWKVLQILDIANNNFDGALPRGIFLKLQAMLDNVNSSSSKPDHPHLRVRYDNGMYYQDSVTVVVKSQEIELVKILTVFTSIDLSSNHFVGSIPEEVGKLGALYFLNLSNNGLTGQIPSSIGDMGQLESLDLSRNKLNGSIPVSLASLNFLSFLNLSYNDLTGPIPSGSQIQTFTPKSFLGNKGLWGCPLTDYCRNGVISQNTTRENDSESENGIDWNLISGEIGLIVGFGVLIVPLVFCKRWRKMYFERIDEVGVRLFPKLYRTSVNKKRRRRP